MFFRRKREIEGETLEELLESAGLSDRYEVFHHEEWPAVWLRTEPADDSVVGVGQSKLGGNPDLAEGLAWPENGGRPLMFLAQLRLADLEGIPGADVLPASGLLSFFYDKEQPWGYAPEHAACWRVLHLDETALHRVPAPEAAPALPVCCVTATPRTTIPDLLSAEVEDLVLSNVESDDYAELSEIYAQEFPGPEHQMLGHPVLVQGDMRWDCALVAHGFDLGDGTAYNTEEAAALQPEAHAWKLLLQLDSDEDAGMMWGDAGLLYFWIHEDDLAKGDFSRVRVMLQCT